MSNKKSKIKLLLSNLHEKINIKINYEFVTN